MYYINILNKVPYTTVQYITTEYFQDKECAKYYIENIFKPIKYDPDSCIILCHGKAEWNRNGHLTSV